MSNRREDTTKDIDWITVSLYLGLVLTGWLMIYAVGYREEYSAIFNFDTRHGKQIMWIGLSIVVGILIMIIDAKFYRTFAFPIYGIGLFFLAAVLVAGQEVAGSTSWFNLGGFKFQPSEFAKFTTCLGLAAYLSSEKFGLMDPKVRVMALVVIGAPMGLIILQGDAGSTLVFTSFVILLFREGMPLILYIIGISVATISVLSLLFNENPEAIMLTISMLGHIVLLRNLEGAWRWPYWITMIIVFSWMHNEGMWLILFLSTLMSFGTLAALVYVNRTKARQLMTVLSLGVVMGCGLVSGVTYFYNDILKPHQQDRIKVWLHNDQADPAGSAYNLRWSMNAIGSGGITGKGYLEGTITKLNYVPEQATDFIFCTVGEEQGFIGAFAVIGLFTLLLLRITIIAERQRSRFTRIYAYGVVSILLFHLIVNIGMTMGLVPIIGIPLPFISYGGSSLISFTILLAILLKLDSDRKLVFR